MKDKIVEYARLHPEEVALAVEHIDSAEIRDKFLRTLACTKIMWILKSNGMGNEAANLTVRMLLSIDEIIRYTNESFEFNEQDLIALINNYKNETKTISN